MGRVISLLLSKFINENDLRDLQIVFTTGFKRRDTTKVTI
jgi:hypothetical protein